MPLSDEQRREAVGLLAELLLDAARRKRVRSDGAFDGVLGGASGGVDSLPDEDVRARRAA